MPAFKTVEWIILGCRRLVSSSSYLMKTFQNFCACHKHVFVMELCVIFPCRFFCVFIFMFDATAQASITLCCLTAPISFTHASHFCSPHSHPTTPTPTLFFLQVQVKLSPCSAAVEHGDAASLLRLARADSGSEALTRVRLCVRTDDLQPEGAGTSQQQQQISKPAAADVDATAAVAAAAPRDGLFYPKPDALAPPARACERAETTSQPPPTTTSLMCYGTDYAAALRKPVQESQD